VLPRVADAAEKRDRLQPMSTAPDRQVTAAEAAARANWSASWLKASAASQADAAIVSLLTNSRAHLCLIAWKLRWSAECSRTLV